MDFIEGSQTIPCHVSSFDLSKNSGYEEKRKVGDWTLYRRTQFLTQHIIDNVGKQSFFTVKNVSRRAPSGKGKAILVSSVNQYLLIYREM